MIDRVRTGSLLLAALVLLSGIPTVRADVCDGISQTANTSLESVVVATGLTGRPLYVAAPPGDTNRIFILEQDGVIWIKKKGDADNVLAEFLDISALVDTFGNEMGLLGLAFDPDYATSGHFYVNYTERVGFSSVFTVVARYSVSAGDPDVADTTETRIMRFSQPQTNHNGGQIEFGPDGYLYVFTGDGGNADDEGSGHATCGNGQSLATPLGKILRVDVRGIATTPRDPDCGNLGIADAYTVPLENPFDDGAGGNCDEIWAYGLRNPWRSDFDSLNGDLYVADVGQNCFEEINYVATPGDGGENYGWRWMEGDNCFDSNNSSDCTPTPQTCDGDTLCNDAGFTDPVYEYCHNAGDCPVGFPTGCSVTGGHVYRGCRMSGFQGKYFYGEFCQGWIRSFEISGGSATNVQDWTADLDPGGSLVNGLTSFGKGAQGEIYIADRDGLLEGQILKIVPPFTDLEVSAANADRLLLSNTDAWTWEDVFFTSEHDVNFYRIYRGTPNGNFSCIHTTTVPSWPAGGDPTTPAPGELFAYVVTALASDCDETATGHPGTFDPTGCTCTP